MNKNKWLIVFSLLLSILFTAQLSTSADCPSLSQFYYATNNSLGDLTGTGIAYIRMFPFTAKCANCYGGKTYSKQPSTLLKKNITVEDTFALEQNCSSVTFNFPVNGDLQLFDDNFKVLKTINRTLDATCNGNLASNGQITATCSFSDDVKFFDVYIGPGTVIEGVTQTGVATVTVPFEFTSSFSARPIENKRIPKKIKKAIR